MSSAALSVSDESNPPPAYSLRLWPPRESARSTLVDRITTHLSSISFFSQKYGRIETSDAASRARRIEESAFQSASALAADNSDISVVQFYAREASKLMLESLKQGPSLQHTNGVDSASPSPPKAAVGTSAVFDVSGGSRGFLTKEESEELLRPLSVPGNSITRICLSNRSFGLDAAYVAERLLRAIRGQLADVNLADIVAGRQEVEALAVMRVFSQALSGSKLRSLNLSDNALGEKGVRAFSSLLETQSDLEELYFINNGISEEAAAAICELLPSAAKLKVLHFHNNMSGDGGAEALSKLVRDATLLEDFRFSSSRVGGEGGIFLAEAVGSASSLRKLDLRDNPFGLEVGISLSKSLRKHLDLTEVYLSYLGFEDEGVIAVSNALKEGAPALEVLDLAGNDITAKGAKAVAQCVSSKSTIIKLVLSENELKDKGTATICEAVRNSNEKLVELDLSSNDMGSVGATAAARAVSLKAGFKLLNLDGNHIPRDGIEAVEKELRQGVCGLSVLGPLDENEEDEENLDDSGSDNEEEADGEGDEELEKQLKGLKV